MRQRRCRKDTKRLVVRTTCTVANPEVWKGEHSNCVDRGAISTEGREGGRVLRGYPLLPTGDESGRGVGAVCPSQIFLVI